MRQHSDNCVKTHGRVFSVRYLHRCSLVAAVALCAAVAALTARAADWTDANNATYTALKSIKGGGSAYIVTAITPAGTETVKLKFQPTVISGKSGSKGLNEALFCSRISTADAAQFSGFKLANKIRIDRGGVHGTCATSLPAANSDYAIVADFANGTASINGTPTTLSPALGTGDYTPTQPLYLYASHESGDNIGYKGYFWLYYFQMYSSEGVLQHNFMPAVCDSNSVTGLYDTVQRKFYAPTGGSFINSAARTVTAPSGCKKWTGLGADNKMSTDANWEGGVAPQAGDNLDFTLAAPLAEINADMNVTFGKVWIDDGDLPGFTGTLTATAINDLERMTDYDTETDGFTFTLAAPSGQDLTWNGGVAANWNTTDALWLCNSAASVWYDHNNAIFNTAGATATLTENAEANSLAFSKPATVAGSATLTVPSVVVAADVSATISAPTAGALEKTGAGILTLASSRTDATTLSEGTLELSGTASLDWTKFTFGTDPAKPVTLEFGTTAAFSSVPSTWKIGNEANITSTIVKNGGDWTASNIVIGNANGASTTFINDGGNLMAEDYFRVGDYGSATLVVSGGTVGSSSSESKRVFVGNIGEGTLVVTNGGVFSAKQSLFVAYKANGTVNVSDGGFVHSGGDIVFHYGNTDGRGVINLGRGGVIEAGRAYSYYSGLASFKFDGGTYRQIGNKDFFAANDTGAAIDVTVSANGGTLDNNALAVALPCTITGEGGMTLSGSGTTTISANQSYLGTTTVSNETTLSVSGGVTFAGPVEFNEDSALDIAGYNGTTPLSATAITFPDEGTVALTLDSGAFDTGVYKICAADDLTAADGEKFSIDTGDKSHMWSMHDNTLILTVGTVDPNAWTGLAGDGNLSNPANWYGGAVPESGTATINCGAAATLTVGTSFSPDVIVFPETCGAVTIKGENAITGIMAITNLSSSICTFEVPVEFADKILVIQNAVDWSTRDQSSVRFARGVTGTDFAEGTARYLNGAYTLTAAEDWIANTQGNKDRWGIPKGSSLTLPFSSDTSEIALGEHNSETGGAFTAAVVRTSARVSCWNLGEYVVTEELAVTLSDADGYISYRGSAGTYKFEKLTLSDNGTSYNFYVANSTRKIGTKHLYIGAGGINVNGTAGKTTALVCGYDDQNSHDVTHLHPWHSDYAINGKGGSTRDLLIYRDTFIHTVDENGVARTVTLNGIADVRAALTIDGSGKLRVNSNGMNGENPPRLGDTTVTDSATLAYASGADLGAGAVTVGVNATLEVASGVNTFEGGLTLDDGATLSFNFTKRTVAPQIAIAEGKTLTANGAVKVKIPEGSLRPTGGEYVLTTCGGFDAEKVTLVDGAPKWVRSLSVVDGNIVLDVKPMGTKVIVR